MVPLNVNEKLSCFSSAFWEIINCWNYLGCKGPEIVYLYSKYGIDAEISKLYDEYLEGLITSKRLVTEVSILHIQTDQLCDLYVYLYS